MHPDELVGQTLGHYRIKRQIGYGGMATVFLADDVHLGREVALKVFWPRPGETKDFLRRFTREARVLAQLDHPHILPVYDYGEQGEIAFLVMPYMSGGTLKELLRQRKALPPFEAIQLISQVLPALQYAHERNLIHRDIKPANLLFKADGSVVLADFGLVKVLAENGQTGISLQTTSETGLNIAGTPEYMPPEQIDGRAVPASDIYALGIVLYEMVTGKRPFQTGSLLHMLMKQAHEAVRPPREINPTVSPQLEAVILKALEKDPLKRFARPADFLQALKQANSQTLSMSSLSQTILSYGPGSPSAPTVESSQQGIAGYYSPLPPVQAPSHVLPIPPKQTPQPRSQPGVYQTPPAQALPRAAQPIQAWAPLQTMAPSFVPQQPKRSRKPLAALLIVGVLLLGLVAALFVTPLRALLSPQHLSITPLLGKNTTTVQQGTQPARGVHTTIPGGTQAITGTLTGCPAENAARAATVAPLKLGNDPTIVSIVNTIDANGNPTSGSLILFDTVNGQKTELVKTDQEDITEAQISDDGQWILFSALVTGRSELRMVRLDGHGQQTLLCAPSGMAIRDAQWSVDQRYVIFDEFPQTGEPTVYLLNTQTGSLQVEVTAPGSGAALVPRTWLDNSRVLMVGIIPDSGAPPQNISILNLGNGARQDPASIAPVFTPHQPCWNFDSSYDGQTLFIAQCTPGVPTGSSTISQQPATGGTLSTIMDSTTLAFTTIRVIDSSSNHLLALASNRGQGSTGDLQGDGLYVLNTDASGHPLRLTNTPAGMVASLNTFSQYFWSNVSRDTTMYALTMVKTNGNNAQYNLAYGQLSGGTLNTFASGNQPMAIVGWTTI